MLAGVGRANEAPRRLLLLVHTLIRCLQTNARAATFQGAYVPNRRGAAHPSWHGAYVPLGALTPRRSAERLSPADEPGGCVRDITSPAPQPPSIAKTLCLTGATLGRLSLLSGHRGRALAEPGILQCLHRLLTWQALQWGDHYVTLERRPADPRLGKQRRRSVQSAYEQDCWTWLSPEGALALTLGGLGDCLAYEPRVSLIWHGFEMRRVFQ
jgi:hypothetical protein